MLLELSPSQIHVSTFYKNYYGIVVFGRTLLSMNGGDTEQN